MRNFTLAAICILSVLISSGQVKDNLYELYDSKQFPALHAANNNPDHPYYYFYKAVYANASNKPDSSLYFLKLFTGKKKTPPKELAFAYYKLENENYIRSFQFPEAEKTGRALVKKFAKEFTEDELKGSVNANLIWKALIRQPRQRIEQPVGDTLAFTRDLAGLINIKVGNDSLTTDFVFDTGAGLSSITESLAEKIGFTILPDSGILVSGFNNIYNPVRIAIAPRLQMGDIVVYNEPFLVFKDEALTFANGAYKINGIIGFPIAKELGRIIIEPKQLVIQKHTHDDPSLPRNFFMETLRPVLMMTYKGRMLPFNFDTGANYSSFTREFYELDSAALNAAGTRTTSTNAGAGGATTNEVLRMSKLEFVLNGETITFSNVPVDPGLQEYSKENLYGNIGQDLLRQYKKVILDFGNSHFRLEN